MANPGASSTTGSTNGKLTLNIGNLRAFQHCSSPAVNIGGFKWHLDMTKAANNTHNCGHLLDAHVFCELDAESTSVQKLWMCKAEVKLNLLSFGTTKSDVFYFFNGRTHYHWAGAIFIMDGSVNYSVEMEVSVERHNLRSSMPMLDTDLKMEYNGKETRVAVNKIALAAVSSYFNNLFLGNWSERSAGGNNEGGSGEFGMKEEADFDVDAFKLMLYSAMAMGWMVHEGKFMQGPMAMTILKLSIKYDVPMLQDYCQKYLLDSSDCPKMEVLEVAEQLGIQQLKDHCLATISAADVVDNFVRNAAICARLSEASQKALNERLAESAKKMRQPQGNPGAAAVLARINQATPAANNVANIPAGANVPAGVNGNERRNRRPQGHFGWNGNNRRQRRQNEGFQAAAAAGNGHNNLDLFEFAPAGWGDEDGEEDFNDGALIAAWEAANGDADEFEGPW